VIVWQVVSLFHGGIERGERLEQEVEMVPSRGKGSVEVRLFTPGFQRLEDLRPPASVSWRPPSENPRLDAADAGVDS